MFPRVKEQPYLVLPADSLYIPLENVPKSLHDAIWGRILQFALDVDQYPYKFDTPDELSFQRLHSTYKHIPMVSKTFRVRHLMICQVNLFDD